ncbi:hypothetical protein MAGR_10710 [Mycolicibacterium agri]|uniref:YchJ-like middle NTF2-like domain-containing protein n=1 Tax=Mycolicibacterium agri TaxID=36811 RepID=A0A7I9VWH8_MYCAG|nr:hypothetical protein MAGR_10710 [Mycolicibacterium agri]
MRSRYTAYAVGDLDYVWRTWHPRTRPEVLTPSDEVWTGLEILDVIAGAAGDDEGWWSSGPTTAERDEVGQAHARSTEAPCTSGPTSPSEPVGGSTWTGNCSVDRSGQHLGGIGVGQLEVVGYLLGQQRALVRRKTLGQ